MTCFAESLALCQASKKSVSRIAVWWGDISPAGKSFVPKCIIHMAGTPEPNLSVTVFKELASGLLTAFPNFQVTIKDQMVSGDKVAFRFN